MNAHAIFDIHKAALADLDERSNAIYDREGRARRLIEKCAAERKEIE